MNSTPSIHRSTVVHAFNRQADLWPERLAVHSDAESWTYAELLARARSISGALVQEARSRSVARVAFLTGQIPLGIAAMLGIARVGMTWIALDPRHPQDRLRKIVSDADVQAIVADPANMPLAAQLADHRALISARVDRPAPSAAPAAPIAYILYTSGSTGNPKGVLQSHHNLQQHIDTYITNLEISGSDRLSLLPALSVDAGLMDVFAALCSGASLHFFDLWGRDVEALPDWLDAQRISIYHSTPTIFRALIGSLRAGRQLSTVRRVVLGGEAAYQADFAAFGRHFSAGAVLINGLGPTESTIALQAAFQATDCVEPGPLPVGRPVEGMEAFLLDENGRQADDIGQLVLRGSALALGYWNDERLTRAAFLRDPNDGNRRMYLTGDLARRLPDGSFVHIGRTDGQIKLHGHRIEPREVEAAIQRELPSKHVSVVKAQLASGAEVLVAVLVAPKDGALDAADLRERLHGKLPSYMVPSRFLIRDRIPLTLSGKIDLAALAREISANDAAIPADEPFSATEMWLSQQWRELLDVQTITPASDFFEIGGNSLTATQLSLRIAGTFGVRLSPSSFFERPSLAGQARLIDAGRSGSVDKPSVVARPPIDLPIPLTLAQEQIWISQRLANDRPIYNVSHCLRIEGPLDINALRMSLFELVHRHDALRLSIAVCDGVPWQTVSPVSKLDFEYCELSGKANEEAQREALAKLRAARAKPFDLGSGKVLRASVVQTTDETYYLLLAVHHIAADGVSLRLIFSEWRQLYAAAILGRGAAALGVALGYSGYALWQRNWIGGKEYADLKAWGTRQLAGLAPLCLPTDRSRPRTRSFQGRTHRFAIGHEAAKQLRGLARARGLTLYTACLASFALVLARHSGQTDFGIATPVANRRPSGTQNVIGNFVNTAIVRVSVDEDSSVGDYLSRIRQLVMASLDRENMPLSHVLAEIAPTSTIERQAPFQAMLVVQDLPEIEFSGVNLVSRPVLLDEDTVVADVCLTVHEDSADLRCELEYASELFDDEPMIAMASHVVNALHGLLRQSEIPVASVDMLGAERIGELARGVGGTARPYDLQTSVCDGFARIAGQHPGRIALVAGGLTLTYAQIAGASDRIAAQLRALGVGPGRLVPVLSSRIAALPAMWLGVIKSGAGFVPIDTAWPHERIETALARCGSDVLVTEEGFEPWRAIAAYRLVTARYDAASGGSYAPMAVSPELPIYGIFTSGSTGTPKLAVVAHRGINNRFAWMTETFAAEGCPVTLQTTPHVYDSAVWQLLWPLTCGGKVVIPSEKLTADTDELLELVREHGVTIVDFVPSIFELIVQSLETRGSLNNALDSLRFVILGGEAIRPRAVDRFKRLAPHLRIVNLYGPTEATIGCISCFVDNLPAPYPIGRPIPNVQVLLLDGRSRLVPVGVPGEIYLGGYCLGLGYWRDQDATNRAFINNPYAHYSGIERLYRTGDIGRMRSDGSIDFLGRIDREIKLRGVRIHPGEIESVLRQHPSVVDAFVAVSTDIQAPSLCAWLEPGVPMDIRMHCRERMPLSMIPERFIDCSALPRLAGGKVDIKSLPAPFQTSAKPVSAGAPQYRSTLERQVAGLWRTVLNVEVVETDHNFFDIGGNSLLAIRLHYLLDKELGLQTSLVDVFRYPTIESFTGRFSREA
jgi:amino acid adenylation domain-containing protein